MLVLNCVMFWLMLIWLPEISNRWQKFVQSNFVSKHTRAYFRLISIQKHDRFILLQQRQQKSWWRVADVRFAHHYSFWFAFEAVLHRQKTMSMLSRWQVLQALLNSFIVFKYYLNVYLLLTITN
jgi:hypothetical protein